MSTVKSSIVNNIFRSVLQEQEEATKARRYRFLKQSEEMKAYPLPGTKENQVDEGRNHYPTSFKLLSLAPPFQKPRKSTPWDLTFSPRSLREPAKSSQTASWLPRPLPSSTRPSERTGVMTAPQARWLVPHRQGKSKEVGPQGDRRSRTTSRPPRLAGIPLAGPRSTAAWRKRRRQAGPQGSSLAARRPGRSFAATGLSSFASTERRRPPGEAVRSPASPRAIRRSGPKAAAPGKRPPR